METDDSVTPPRPVFIPRFDDACLAATLANISTAGERDGEHPLPTAHMVRRCKLTFA